MHRALCWMLNIVLTHLLELLWAKIYQSLFQKKETTLITLKGPDNVFFLISVLIRLRHEHTTFCQKAFPIYSTWLSCCWPQLLYILAALDTYSTAQYQRDLLEDSGLTGIVHAHESESRFSDCLLVCCWLLACGYYPWLPVECYSLIDSYTNDLCLAFITSRPCLISATVMILHTYELIDFCVFTVLFQKPTA